MGSQRFITVVILLAVGQVCCNNQPPFIGFDGPLNNNLFVYEDLLIGSSLFSITATDQDNPSTLIFTGTNDETRQFVSIANVTHDSATPTLWKATVYLNKSLDRDRSPQSRSLVFTVSDGTLSGEGTVTLIIRDVNDNPPNFEKLPYSLTIPEGIRELNKTVFVVSASDPDTGPGGAVTYSMAAQAQGADMEYNNTFKILNEFYGNITLTLPLDYESINYYQFQVFSKDRASQQCPGPTCRCSSVTEPQVNCAGSPALFTVVVTDVQDTPPFFERLPYVASVKENATVGTSIFQVSAQDGDRGVPNAITFSIVDGTKYPFQINATNGDIMIGSAGLNADRDTGTTSYILTIMASEVIKPNDTPGGVTNATTQLSISVIDINDNPPVFNEKIYYATVNENTPRGVPLDINSTVSVSDADHSLNSNFELTVYQNGSPSPMFGTIPKSIQDKSTVLVTVNDSTILDYEKTHNITFELVAREVGTTERLSSTATVILFIEDMNDNSPIFTAGQQTTLNVSENKENVKLATYTATDRDSGDFGTVRYSLENNPSSNFYISEKDGLLILLKPLNRNTTDTYSLVVIATDNNNDDEAQRRSVRLNVRVNVIDVNDNAPVFIPHPREVSVQENASPETTLMTVTAQDKDAGDNAKVTYEILSIVPISPSSSQPNGKLFAIHPYTGVLSVSNETTPGKDSLLLDRPGDYNVTIIAYDSPQNYSERLNDTTWVMVTVVDVNIHSPVFINPDQFILNVSLGIIPNITTLEEQPIGTPLMVLNATDADAGENGLVLYYLEPDLGQQFLYFTVNPLTGALAIKERLDREKFPSFQITLKAEDRGRPRPLSTTIPLKIILKDIDDNQPEFPMDDWPLSVGEETQNVEVGYVNKAIDKDLDPQNILTCYYIYGGEMVNSFQLNKTSGRLMLIAKLDRDQTPRVTIFIKASGNCILPENFFISGGNNKTFNSSDDTTLRVVVTVNDINDNGPVFDQDALTVGLLFDKEIGFEVIYLVTYTHDNDTEQYRKNFYRLVDAQPEPPASPTFPFILTGNGSIITKQLFSADDNRVFTLKVMAYDADNHNDTADVLIYLVSNIERVKLVFNRQPQEVENIKGELVRKLGEALGFTIIADKIATHVTTSQTADPTKTDMFIHARYIPSGQIVPPTVLLNNFDYKMTVRDIFRELGVAETSPLVLEQTKKDDGELEKAFIIVAVVLAIIVLALALVLFNAVRRYRRRLRAATTSAYVKTKEDLSSNYVPPGTNKYFAAENPLFGRDVKPVDIDRLGDNDSLDDNAVDGAKAKNEREKEEEQEMYLDLFDERHNGPGSQPNHLEMVLQEYEKAGMDTEYDELSQSPDRASSIMDGNNSPHWKSSLNGHVKADSGFSENVLEKSGHSLDNLQYTDI